jgi:hypothetical protein
MLEPLSRVTVAPAEFAARVTIPPGDAVVWLAMATIWPLVLIEAVLAR